MKERILLAPGMNGAELLRTLAKNGQNTLGLRVMNGVQLAQEALIRSGIVVTEEFLTRREEASLYDSFFRGIPYFASASFADAQQVSMAVYRVRSLCLNDSEGFDLLAAEGEFPEKNQALREAFKGYVQRLSLENRIDSIGLMQKALREADGMESEFICLKEFPLSPLEQALLDKLSTGEGRESDLMEMLGAKPASVKIDSCTRGYGAVNEVESILTDILSKGIPLDQCTVAVTDPAFYSELFYDYSVQYGLPMSFGTGLPISLTNPGKLLKLLLKWEKTGYNGIDATVDLWASDCFEKESLMELLPIEEEASDGKRFRKLKEAAELAGSLRLGLDDEENRARLQRFESSLERVGDERKYQLLPVLKAWADALSEGLPGLIRRFSVIRSGPEGRLDRAAVNVVTEILDACARYGEKVDPMEAVPLVLDHTVASENSREGELYVTNIPGALGSLRPNLYIAGLSCASFPGKLQENYLLLDSDLELFPEGGRWTSDRILLDKKKALASLVDLACSLGSTVHLSYPYYDLAQLKELNPSSSVFELYQRANGEAFTVEEMKKTIRHAGYFDSDLSGSALIGKAYLDGKTHRVEQASGEDEMKPMDPMQEEGYSPTGDIEVFFECPRKFYLTRVLGIKVPEEDDPFQVIGPMDIGKLAHSLMEELGRNSWTLEEFLGQAGERFDIFLEGRPPLNPQKVDGAKRDFIRMMKNAYEMEMESDHPAALLLSEATLEAEHPAGVRLKGRIDWLSENENGEATVVDFKTGRWINQEENDVVSCLQTMLYAYMVEESGIAGVKDAEYRYLRLHRRIRCEYDEAAKKELERLLTIFRDSLVKGEYPYPQEEDREKACRYCKLKPICGVDEERKEAAGDE